MVIEKIKEKIKKIPELTPELEEQIRTDERTKFASSFNFQSLFINDEPPVDWKSYLVFGVLFLEIIIIFKIW